MDGVILSLVPLVGGIAFFAMIAFIVWATVRGRERRAQMAAEVQTRLIERFGSSAEFVSFLRSDEGRQFIGGLEDSPRVIVRDRVLGSLRRGIVVTLLGAGFLGLAMVGERWGIYPGFILFFLGAGYFLSALVSMKLSKSWGLMGDAPTTEVSRSSTQP